MKQIRGRRPSPALVISVISLAVALSGTAVGLPGKNKVDSGDVKNNNLQSKDVKDNNLLSQDLKDGAAVGAADLVASQRTRWALVAGDGAIVKQSGGIAVVSASSGRYVVDFGESVSGRAIMTSSKFPQAGPTPLPNTNGLVEAAICGASVASSQGETVNCTPASNNDTSHVFVQTATASGSPSNDPRPFYIAVLPQG
jgi:hypothetical protein